MGLLRRVVTLPLAPLEGMVWLATVLERVAQEELSDPARLRAVLDEAEAAHARGELTDEELASVEDAVLDRLAESGSLPLLPAPPAPRGA